MSADARPHFAALQVALNAACSAEVYGYDKVPGTNGNSGALPASFVLLAVERRFNPQLKMPAATTTTGWRASVRFVGNTIGSAELLASQAATALNEVSLTVGAKRSTPIQFESGEACKWDDGKYAGLAFYVYAH